MAVLNQVLRMLENSYMKYHDMKAKVDSKHIYKQTSMVRVTCMGLKNLRYTCTS